MRFPEDDVFEPDDEKGSSQSNEKYVARRVRMPLWTRLRDERCFVVFPICFSLSLAAQHQYNSYTFSP
jgi:hypothetical protein